MLICTTCPSFRSFGLSLFFGDLLFYDSALCCCVLLCNGVSPEFLRCLTSVQQGGSNGSFPASTKRQTAGADVEVARKAHLASGHATLVCDAGRLVHAIHWALWVTYYYIKYDTGRRGQETSPFLCTKCLNWI